jgi:hypothetical protein
MLTPDWGVIENNANRIPLYFAFTYEKKMGFRFIRNGLLTPYSGLHGNISGEKNDEVVIAILNIFSQLPAFDIFNIDVNHYFTFLPQLPSFNLSKKRTNILKLDDEDKIYHHFKSSLQRQIKKANKQLVIQQCNDIKTLATLHRQTLLKRNEKSFIPLKIFNKVWTYCKLNSCGKLFEIIDENKYVHASLLLIFDHDTAYYLCGGTDEAHYGSGAMSGLMWYAIRESIIMKKKYFDFEGSMQHGVNRFFQNFSPSEMEYYNIQKTNSYIFKFLNKK